MPSKRPPTKHTKKAIDAKHRANKLANGGAGGGNSGIQARLTRSSKFKCDVVGCISEVNDMKSLEQHFSSKHAREDWAGKWKAHYEAQVAQRKAEMAKAQASNHGGSSASKKKKGK